MAWSDYGRLRLKDAIDLAFRGNQSALARAIHEDPSTVSRWLSAQYTPSIDDLEAICRATRQDPQFFLRPRQESDDEVAQRVEMLGRQVQSLAQRMRRGGGT